MSFIQTRSSTYQRNQNQRNQNRVCRVKFVVDWIAYQGQRHLRLPSSALVCRPAFRRSHIACPSFDTGVARYLCLQTYTTTCFF